MSNMLPYAVFGATGRTGAAAADALLRAGLPVRVVLRDPARGGAWAARGVEIVQAGLTDADALTRALTGVRGAYVVSPQQYGRADLFELADRIALTVARAAVAARVPKLVALSSVGADLASGSGWIRMNRMLEQRLLASGIPATFVRAAYFMENWTPMIGQAVATGTLPSFLSPGGRRIPMVAAADVGRAGAEFLSQQWTGARAITVSGPRPYSPEDVAAALAAELGKPLRLDVLAQAGWAGAMAGAGAGFSPAALTGFIEMTRGLNSGHIGMDTDPAAEHWAGSIPLAQTVGGMARAVRGAST
jgi:uncharacterized protein YbjT (DUF2867 family)